MIIEKFLSQVYKISFIALILITIILLLINFYIIALSFITGALLSILLLKVNELIATRLLDTKKQKTLIKFFILKYPLIIAIIYLLTRLNLNFLVLCIGIFLPYGIILIIAIVHIFLFNRKYYESSRT